MMSDDDDLGPLFDGRSHRLSQTLAYHKISDEGLLSRLRFAVYKIIYEFDREDGMTSGELDREMSRHGSWTRSASPRLNELVTLRVIQELPLRKCRETKQTVIAYRTTAKLPDYTQLKRGPSCRVMLARAHAKIRELESELESMKEATA